MGYKILIQKAGTVVKTDFAGAAEKLARKVNEAIHDGWTPQGGVAVGRSAVTEIPHLMQAMVKLE